MQLTTAVSAANHFTVHMNNDPKLYGTSQNLNLFILLHIFIHYILKCICITYYSWYQVPAGWISGCCLLSGSGSC